MTQPVPYPQSRNQYIFSDALSCSTTPDMMSKKLLKNAEMWYRKVLKKHDNSLPQKTTMKPKVQRDLHFLRAGTMSGLEHFLGSEFRNHVLQCPSPPPQQVHQSSTAASKKASRDGKRFHQPCEKKPAIRNQSLIVGQFHPPVMDLIFLPGMKTPTIP